MMIKRRTDPPEVLDKKNEYHNLLGRLCDDTVSDEEVDLIACKMERLVAEIRATAPPKYHS